MGPPASMHVDIDGESIWALIRCDETSPVTLGSWRAVRYRLSRPDNKIKNIDTVLQVRREGQCRQELRRRDVHLAARAPCRSRRQRVGDRRGQRAEAWPWRPKPACRVGHQVVKFSPDGKVLMTLGEPGVAGQRPDTTSSRRAPSLWRQRRHLRRRWPWRQREQPRREILEGRQVHQGVG